jgi:hypothetical protein
MAKVPGRSSIAMKPNTSPLPPGATVRADLWVGINWDQALLGPIGRSYREGPWPRFRDRVQGVGWRYRPEYAHPKALLSPTWVWRDVEDTDGGS